MTRSLHRVGAACLVAACGVAASSGPAAGAPLTVPFDFSRAEIGVDVVVSDRPLHVIIDTGVDPSLVDLALARDLGLPVDRREGGEASGFGDGPGARVFPTKLRPLTIGGRAFRGFDALATDLGPLSARYGRRLDMVLGYSFLSDKTILVDYPERTVSLLARASEAEPLTRTCRVRWRARLTTIDGFPVIHDFRFGPVRGAATIDTGSNGGVSLYRDARALPGLRDVMVEDGSVVRSGARGDQSSDRFRFDAPLGFGPFVRAQGQTVTTYGDRASHREVLANVGNAWFDGLRVKMLLDYWARTMTFFGSCE